MFIICNAPTKFGSEMRYLPVLPTLASENPLPVFQGNFRSEVWVQRNFTGEILKILAPVQKAILYIHALPEHHALLDFANVVAQRHLDVNTSVVNVKA